MKKSLTIQEVTKYFKKYKGYLSNPPEEKALTWVLHYITQKNYEMILRKFGNRYLLIVLDFLESLEEYEACEDIVKIIQKYNDKYKQEYPTHISQIKSIY